ncbi:MAG: hypothetical protein IPN67_05200 [Bacteroidales bacterium]|nr:hypothetical protein [Bacteroidales bacterium]
MRKFGKILLITIASLLAVLLLTVITAVYLVFTPERFTPIVRSQMDKVITCKSEVGEVELTFFSTFPHFGIKIRQFALINPVAGSQSDTLIKADKFVGVIDAAAWWNKDELLLTGIELSDGSVNLFTDSLGKTNYDIVAADTIPPDPEESESELPAIDIRSVVLDDVTLSYKDLSLKLNTIIQKLSANLSGTISGDNISGNIQVKKSVVFLEYEGEKYLQQALVKADFPVDLILSRQLLTLKEATVSVNDLELLLNGTIENDTLNQNIITDIQYKFTNWPLESILAMVPPSYTSYIKGTEASGLLSSEGSIKGLVADSAMPVLGIQLLLENGTLKYPDFPLPLHDIEGDVNIITDLTTDSLSSVKINHFNARTPLSYIKMEGIVNHLFTDIFCDITTTAGLTLDEFNQMIPDSMKIKMKGKASGEVRSAFSMSQLGKMQVERMKLSGSVTLSDFNMDYDSISLGTDHSKIDFALPNRKASSKNTKFASITILTDNLKAGKISSYNAVIQNADLSFETSDIRDTTRIPDFICTFKMDSLYANMDTMSIAIAKPYGKVSVSPVKERPEQPAIALTYNSDQLRSISGQSSMEVKTIGLDASIINDNSRRDVFLQWLVKGFIELNEGKITQAGFSYPIEIPSLKMNFDPETFNIRESKIQIDKSDFQLTGILNNIFSYIKGDSILRGNFSFVSNTTDLSQLMALTNGMGQVDSTEIREPAVQEPDSTNTGPYMVPKKVDLLLNVSIKRATMGVDTATNITGNVQVHDGILVLDGLSLETPAAKIQLTALYRTPRKNHLFLGLDYQMRDIEISELLTMIPDIDTLMPMLRSFSGKGEFHIAVETYLDSSYNIKKSTLRGASSINGNDLVLMDGETFSEIAKTLRFNKKTENRVDSLSAEFTIFRNEIDVYPFLLVMDKYKVVIAGRHNFDMTFNYHISVVDCPLPIKLGVDIRGNETDLSYRPAACRYKAFYRPTSRHAVESKRLELKKLIREALSQNTTEQ